MLENPEAVEEPLSAPAPLSQPDHQPGWSGWADAAQAAEEETRIEENQAAKAWATGAHDRTA